MNKVNKVVICLVFLGILCIVIGTSYAMYNIVIKGKKEILIETAKISFSYEEQQESLSIKTLEAMSDEDGKTSDYYEFYIKGKSIEPQTINYVLYLEKIINTNNFSDSDIKLYLTKVENGVEVPLNQPKLISEYAMFNDDNNTRAFYGNKFKFDGIDTSEQVHIYRFRVWLSDTYNIDNLLNNSLENGNQSFEINEYKYEFKLNVATGKATLPVASTILSKDIVTTGDGLYECIDTTIPGSSSYYFKGNVDNYLIFAEKLWRVVRVNEDGTIRIILQDGIDDNTTYMYVNAYSTNTYMYFSNSTIKTTLQTWYDTNLLTYDDKIATSTFCEAAMVTDQTDNSPGSATMYDYADYTPNFSCGTDRIDGNGYGLITNQKIGLITYDEAILAGGIVGTDNTEYYLYNGQHYWTMSPGGFYDSGVAYDGSRLWTVSNAGKVYTRYTAGTSSGRLKITVRPVINLRGDLIITGDGSELSPWTVQ